MRRVTSFPSFSFEGFELDTFARRLTRDGQPIAVADRHFDVLYRLVSQAGELVTKEALVTAGWGDVAVTDNSLEQAISSLRRGAGSASRWQPVHRDRPAARLPLHGVGRKTDRARHRRRPRGADGAASRVDGRPGGAGNAGGRSILSRAPRLRAGARGISRPRDGARRPGERVRDAIRDDARGPATRPLRRWRRRSITHARPAGSMRDRPKRGRRVGFVLGCAGKTARRAGRAQARCDARARQLASSLPAWLRELGRRAAARSAANAGAASGFPAGTLAGGDRPRRSQRCSTRPNAS